VATKPSWRRLLADQPTNGNPGPSLPAVGDVIRKLRQQRGLSLKTVADKAGLSPSFLGAVERGQSDIAVGRLAAIATVLGHDLASLLGYTLGQSQPRFIRGDERIRMRRGRGVSLTAIKIPGTNLELLSATLAPHSKDKPVTHAGLDVLLVVEGRLTLSLDGADYPMTAGDCAVWPSSHKHAIRNDFDQPAHAIGIVTEAVY